MTQTGLTDFLARASAAVADRYLIERELGAGGMGTVYLAQDLRHDRRVALKFLRPELGVILGVDRFLAEIRLTAKLQHPNIVPLFESGVADSLAYYVMPFIEGETLRHRLEREGQLPIDRAVAIAGEVASALAYAHEKGIVHRDIKPENILFEGGHAVVTDFGIALAIHQAGGNRLTETGISLGTPGYMSPEQATGGKVDGRSDIYALAAVVYEMMAGALPYQGNSAQAVMAKALTEQAEPVTEHRPLAGPKLAAALDRGLAKLPADRFATADLFAAALTSGLSAAHESSGRRASVSTSWKTAGVAGLALVAGAIGWAMGHRPPSPATSGSSIGRSFELPLEVGDSVALPDAWGTFTPDGQSYVAWGYGDKGYALYQVSLRRLGQATPIAGTEGDMVVTTGPSIAPDGRALIVGVGRTIRRLGLDGRPPYVIATLPTRLSAVQWISPDTIVATATDHGVWAVSVEERAVHRIAVLDSAIGAWGIPSALPGGRIASSMPDLRIAVTDPRWSRVTYLPSSTRGVVRGWLPAGFLLFGHPQSGLFAVPIDPSTGTATGNPTRVVDGGEAFAIGPGGAVAFHRHTSESVSLRYLREDGAGPDPARETVVGVGASVSPDGRFAAIPDPARISSSLGLRNLATGDQRSLHLTPARYVTAVFTPRGDRIALSRIDDSTNSIVVVSAVDGSTIRRLAVDSVARLEPTSWSVDGTLLAYTAYDPITANADCWVVDSGGRRTLVAGGDTRETGAQISPRADWIAFTSNRSGRREVYVRKLPLGSDQPIALSPNGGFDPAWSADGATLYYRTATVVMTVPVRSLGTRGAAVPRVRYGLSSAEWEALGDRQSYYVLPDGRVIARIAARLDWRLVTNVAEPLSGR